MHLCADFHAGPSKEYLIFDLLVYIEHFLSSSTLIPACSCQEPGGTNLIYKAVVVISILTGWQKGKGELYDLCEQFIK